MDGIESIDMQLESARRVNMHVSESQGMLDRATWPSNDLGVRHSSNTCSHGTSQRQREQYSRTGVCERKFAYAMPIEPSFRLNQLLLSFPWDFSPARCAYRRIAGNLPLFDISPLSISTGHGTTPQAENLVLPTLSITTGSYSNIRFARPFQM